MNFSKYGFSMRTLFLILILLTTLLHTPIMAERRTIKLHWLHTSDLHSSLFGYDYLTRRATTGGLASIYSYVHDARRLYGDNVILTDGGDLLQGQPLAYYYNYVDTTSTHLVAACMNELRYDAAAIGNHDIEAGHDVYDRFMRDCQFPFLGANIIDVNTGKPYLKPYEIIYRDGVKIAILGMLTPGIPNWLPANLWSGLRFEDMVESSRRWMSILQQEEHPDVVVGLFHSGWEGGIITPESVENASRLVAEQVAGFDLILYGHDHRALVSRVRNEKGGEVVCIGPSSQGMRIGEAEIVLTIDDGKVVNKKITGKTTNMYGAQMPNALAFEALFVDQRREVEEWIGRTIGTLSDDLMERDAYFGPCYFIDVLHEMQLELTGADISFAAPISFDSKIPAGTLRVSDMFTLYKYENFLYTMRMTGREVKGFLEMSYGLWTNQMSSASDHALLLDHNLDNGRHKGLKNLSYNMEAAAGISYDVDLTKPIGERIIIHSMADGTPFEVDKEYCVAMNSYRGNGGGELMTRGAGIPHDSLASRILWSSDKDLRYYLIQRVVEKNGIRPRIISNWQFVPKAWTIDALKRDRKIIFPDE